jgi:hypothetical protein
MCQAKAIYAQIIHRLIHNHPTRIRGRVSTAQGQAGFPHFKAQKRNMFQSAEAQHGGRSVARCAICSAASAQ